MPEQIMRLCTCHKCHDKRAFDPVTGHIFAGQYLGEKQYKDHRRLQNAVDIASSRIGNLRAEVIPCLNPSQLPDVNGAGADAGSRDPTSTIRMSTGNTPSPPNPQIVSDQDTLLMKQLRAICNRIYQADVEEITAGVDLVFRKPPHTSSPPMSKSTPIYSALELDPSVPSNTAVVHHETLLRSTQDIVETINEATNDQGIQALAHECLLTIEKQQSFLFNMKLRQWEQCRSRSALLSLKSKFVDATRYVGRPLMRMHSFLLVCYFLVAYMQLICGISLINCRILLFALRKLASLSAPSHLDSAGRDLQSDIPANAETVLSFLDLRPKATSFICCAKCFTLYTYNPDTPKRLPERCTNRRAPDSSPCNAPIFIQKKGKGRKPTPIRLFLYHELEEYIAELYARQHTEDWLDRPLSPLGDHSEIQDILDAPEIRTFLGPEGDPTRPFLQRPGNEGRLIFSLNMDGFNPYTNKESGKKVSVGAIYLVCLNLPLSKRYEIDNMFLVGLIPGPHEPSKEQINHILTPLVDDLLVLWEHGFFLTSTARYAHGRLIRGAVIPLVCDLPAARQMSGFAGFSSRNFCALCTLQLSKIENLDFHNWPSRTWAEHMHWASKWKDATSEGERVELYKKSGIRWSELLRLPYWDPTKFVVIDSMHGFFLGMFQRHCRQVWGMGVDIADVDYPSFAQDRQRPSEEKMKSAYAVFRFGSEAEMRKLELPMLRQLARATGALSFGGKAKRVIDDLLAYRVRRGWFASDGTPILDVDSVPIEDIQVDIRDPDANDSMRCFRDEAEAVLQKLAVEQQGAAKIPTKGKRSRIDPPTTQELADALKLVEVGSKRKISVLRKAILICVCRTKDIHLDDKCTNPQIVEAIEAWRLAEGIIDIHGNLVNTTRKRNPKRKATGVLGQETLKQVREDMEKLELPSWVAAAPRNPGEAKRGKFTADQWRTFCTINLTLTLNRLWGQEKEGSRRRLMLDNFMHLIAAVKIASKRSMTPALIAAYVYHMHAYLTSLLELYPNTALAPYQHLALHLPRFLQGFGPVNAWRCFPFERYNYLLQNIPTNMKFGELETTMFNRFCMAQRLRRVFSPNQVPKELDDLILDFEKTEKVHLRGTFLHEDLGHDDFFRPTEETVSWTDEQLKPLPRHWHTLLRHWISQNDSDFQPAEVSAFAFFRSRIRRLGEVYQTQETSSADGHLYYQSLQSISAGCIQGIFTHTRCNRKSGRAKTQTFFIVKEYQPLPPVYEHLDPYRRFSLVGGRLFRRAFYDGETIVSLSEVQHQFALAKVEIPAIPFSTILAIPLDK